MIIWVRIHSTPQRQVYIDPRALAYMDPKQDKRMLLLDPGSLKSTSTGENASVTLVLNNKCGECKQLFGDNPPIAARIELFDAAEQLFDGAVADMALNAIDCRVQVQA
jgi:hypothetical protein